MTNDEARLLLQASRPNGQDAVHPDMRAALERVTQDPALSAWWQAEQAFDRKIAAKLGEIPMPTGLRESLLALEPAETEAVEHEVPARGTGMARRHHSPALLALAALFLALAVAGMLLWPFQGSGHPVLASSTFNAAALQAVQTDPDLPFKSNDQGEIMAWLKGQGAPVGAMPPRTAALPSVGCEHLSVQGRTVSLICFVMNGNLVHVFIIDRDGLKTPPADHPEWSQQGDWATVAWSDTSKSYMMATRAGMPALKSLLL